MALARREAEYARNSMSLPPNVTDAATEAQEVLEDLWPKPPSPPQRRPKRSRSPRRGRPSHDSEGEMSDSYGSLVEQQPRRRTAE